MFLCSFGKSYYLCDSLNYQVVVYDNYNATKGCIDKYNDILWFLIQSQNEVVCKTLVRHI